MEREMIEFMRGQCPPHRTQAEWEALLLRKVPEWAKVLREAWQ